MNKMLLSQLFYLSKTRNQRTRKESHQFSDLSRKIVANVLPVYTSQKFKEELKPKEYPPIVNQQKVVYYFKCALCDVDYIGFMSQHSHKRVEQHNKWATT